MRFRVTVTAFILAASLASGAVQSNHPYRRQYVKDTFGKKAAIGTTGGAVVSHVRNSPHEWGRGPSGLGKRVGSAFGEHIIKNSIQFGVASVRHEDLKYHPSTQRGFGPRLRHALVSTVVTQKTTTGKRTMAAGRVSGAVGSGFISRAWQPARLHTIGSGAATSGVLLGADAGSNVVREFWPEIRHPHAHRQYEARRR